MSEPNLYRLITQENWKLACLSGQIPLQDIDHRDGFIHLSTKDQCLETANRYFDSSQPLLALEISAESVAGLIRWEEVPSRGSAFPHLYAPNLPTETVQALVALERGAAGFTFAARTAIEKKP